MDANIHTLADLQKAETSGGLGNSSSELAGSAQTAPLLSAPLSLSSVPRMTKAAVVALLVLHLLSFLFPSSSNGLALIPGLTIASPHYVWNIITAGYFETSTIAVGMDIVALLFMGRLIEPIWGSFEYSKFILLVNAACGVSTFFLVVIVYMISGEEALIYTSKWHGFSGVLAAFIVAIKQLYPEFEFLAFGVLPLRAKNMPSYMVVLATVLLLLGVESTSLVFVFFGVFWSWLYLRFFQPHPELAGDTSDSFAFVTFFPEVSHPVLSPIFNSLAAVFRVCGFKRKQPSEAAVDQNVPSLADPADAERRRLRGLRSLDARMKEIEVKTQTPAASSSSSVV